MTKKGAGAAVVAASPGPFEKMLMDQFVILRFFGAGSPEAGSVPEGPT